MADIIDVIQALAEVLRADLTNPVPGEPPDIVVYSRPREAVSMADVPCIIITQAPMVEHVWRQEAWGFGRADITLTLYIIVGQRTTALGELHDRCLYWPKALSDVLFQHLSLGAVAEFIGAGDSDVLFRWKIAPIQWDKQTFFGLVVTLPATIKNLQEMAP